MSASDSRRPGDAQFALAMGSVVDRGGQRRRRSARAQRHGISADAIVFGCFGGLSPDKRLPADSRRVRRHAPIRSSRSSAPRRRGPEHYDLAATSSARSRWRRHAHRLSATDEAFTENIAACDVALNLRWPTAREMSGPWLRCLAAGKPTVIVDLAHLADVPTLDPRRGSRTRASASVRQAAPCAPSRSTSSTRITRFGWRCDGSAPTRSFGNARPDGWLVLAARALASTEWWLITVT